MTLFCTLVLTIPFLSTHAAVNVTSNRYDANRSAANLSETTLNPSTVNVNNFGLLWSNSVSGAIFAQPLYVQGVTITGQASTKNVLYVATMQDVVYAFDADNPGSPLWSHSFLSAGVTPGTPFDVNTASSGMGIIGTPVIDASNNKMYLVAETMENSQYVQRLHVIDIRSGADLTAVIIQASSNGLSFNPEYQSQRPGLALADGQVWLAFGSTIPGDFSPWQGWIMTYDSSTLQQTGAFVTTTGNGGGIWQSGAAPAVDSAGNVYFVTGNGTGQTPDGVNNFPESLLKFNFNNGLALLDYYTASNWQSLDKNNSDLSASGPMLVPGTNLVAFGGKLAISTVLDSNKLGHLTTNSSQVVQSIQTGPIATSSGGDRIIGLAYWQRPSNPLLFVWPGLASLTSYSFNGTTFAQNQQLSAPLFGEPAAALSISANGSTTGSGIVWAVHNTASGRAVGQAAVLEAYNADNLNSMLWNSNMNASRDGLLSSGRFVIPVVDNGKVYVATSSGSVQIYGLLQAAMSGTSQTTSSNSSTAAATTVTIKAAAVTSATPATGTARLSLTSIDNVNALATSGTAPINGGMDTAGYGYAANLLGSTVTWSGSTFALGTAAAASAISNATISPTTGSYATLQILGAGVFGPVMNQVFTVAYTDGSTSSFTQSFSDWGRPQNFSGESIASAMTYRVTPTGSTQNGPWYLYGYSFALNTTKSVKSITLPNNRSVVVLAIDLSAASTAAAPVSQTIAFNSVSAQNIGAPLILSATASSGLAVSFSSSTTAVCTVSAGMATFIAAGTCTLTASQVGNASYAAAAPVTQSFAVANAVAAQTLTFNIISTQTVGAPLTLSATATSGLPVSFASSTLSVCTVASSTATFQSTGTCTLTASQAGNANYAAATQVSQSFTVQAAASAAGYDVVLLVGQSNMVGLGTGTDDAGDAAADPRVFQWNPSLGAIMPAFDPLHQNSPAYNIGLGVTFAKAYVKHMAPNRKLLLVGAATGSTGFVGGYWMTPSGTGVTTAINWINAAMTAAGANAHLVGILWHQGENDIGYDGGSEYETNLQNLIAYFRSNITGASSKTPFIAGEMVNAWLTYNLASADSTAQQNIVLNDIHTLPDNVPYTAWTSAAELVGDPYYSSIHFSALSQRQLGRRYADRFFEAANNLPQPQVSQKWWAGTFFDDGRGLGSANTNSIPVNNPATVSGTVTAAIDPVRGNVARISQGQGWLSYQVPGNTFNGSYTKMAWFLPGAVGYGNNLLSAGNSGQVHFLYAQNLGSNQFMIGAGHSAGSVVPAVSAQVTSPAGVWMNIALAYDANAQTMTLYMNGAVIASQSGIAAAPASGASLLPLLMGSYGATGASAMDGELACGRVWKVALSAAQISLISNYEAAGMGNEPSFGIVVGSPSQASQSPASPGISYTVPTFVAAVGGKTAPVPVAVVPNNGFTGSPTLAVTGLPSGASYTLSPSQMSNNYSLQIMGAATSSAAGAYPLVISGATPTASAQAAATLCLSVPDSAGNLHVDLSCFFNRSHNLVTDGTSFSDGGLAGSTGFAYSATLLGTTVTSGSVQFSLGAPNNNNGLSSAKVNVPAGQYGRLALLATGINGAQGSQAFIVTYADGTTSTFTQNLSDWGTPQHYAGESVASTMPYVDAANGTRINATLYLYSYSFALNSAKTIASITMPTNSNVIVMAITMTAVGD